MMQPVNLEPGQALPPENRGRVTQEQLTAYAHASGDFNPIHLDAEVARNTGLPGVIAHGMLGMAFLGSYVARLGGGRGFVRRLKARFVRPVLVGEEVTCCGRVESVERQDGSLDVTLRVWLLGDGGAVAIEGESLLRIGESTGSSAVIERAREQEMR